MTGLWLALVVMAIVAVWGLAWQARQGRLRVASGLEPVLPEQVLRHLDADAAVTLLQLTAPICARCPQAHAVLAELAAAARGVRHTELNLAEHPELAHLLRVRSTPTTLAVARSGQELFRVIGVPRREDLLSALQPHLGS
jgi:thioredoxin-like negative regulator of GroEL